MPNANDAIPVLVVENDPPYLRLLQIYLEAIGMAPTLCATGREAQQAVARGDDYSLLITHVMMAEITGPELVKLLRAKVPNMRVIYISTESLHSLAAQRKIEVPVRAFLQKPFTQEALESKIFELMTDQ